MGDKRAVFACGHGPRSQTKRKLLQNFSKLYVSDVTELLQVLEIYQLGTTDGLRVFEQETAEGFTVLRQTSVEIKQFLGSFCGSGCLEI